MTDSAAKNKRPLNAWIKEFFVLLAIGTIIYFGNQQIQSWLGHKSIENTGLPSTSYSEALALSQETGKPLLINFSAIWCASCRTLNDKVLSNQAVKDKILSDYHFVRLEYDSNDKAIFQQYDVYAFPTMMTVSPEGVITKIPLSYSPDSFIKLI